MKYGIDKFIGTWVSESRYRLEIIKVSSTEASVSLYSPNGAAPLRPYYDNLPTIRMYASYDEYEGDFDISLWKKRSGFVYSLEHEYDYMLDKHERESLAPGLCRNSQDEFLDQYYYLFGPLDHFVREEEVEHADSLRRPKGRS
jgi:hypothetical protein